MFHHVINYQLVSITFVSTIRVTLQEYKEYSKLQKCVSGNTHYLKHLLQY